ncbi:MAG TPA: hypothetical protein VJ957_12155, partial [Longimicrobiales bacterium]|nr:hypothetical protein [Longimicrobiales bacterium]
MHARGHVGTRAAAAALAAALIAWPAGCVRQPAAPDAGGRPVYRIPVSGTIELGLAPYVQRSLREAQQAGARAAVLELETPGGRIDAAQRIVDAVDGAKVPVYAFVNRRAFSA